MDEFKFNYMLVNQLFKLFTESFVLTNRRNVAKWVTGPAESFA